MYLSDCDCVIAGVASASLAYLTLLPLGFSLALVIMMPIRTLPVLCLCRPARTAAAPVYRMACEKAVQRVHRAASDASAAAPRLLTFLVSPAALTRALIVRRAEALHEWRNTILLQASASGAVGA